MTASSRSDGRRHLRTAALFLLMALGSSAMAQEANEVSRLAEEARQAFLSAEQGGIGAKQKATFYQIARARVKLIEKFAGQSTLGSAELRDGARAELTRLADDGLGHDILGSMLLQSSLGDLAGSQAGADRVESGVALHQIASEQRSPAYRAAAFIELAHAYSRAGLQDRALRYASLALETASAIPEAGEQTGAYNAVARLTSGLGPAGAALANRSIGLIPRARDRAYARHDLARDQLKGTAWEKIGDAKLKAEARRRLAAGNLPESLQLALALPDSGDRDDLLSELAAAADKRQEHDVALAAAQSSFDTSKQHKALAAIVKEYIARGTPLQAAEIVAAMQDSPARVSVQLALATELGRAGYDSMADQLFSASLKSVETSKEAAQRAILPDVVRALTRSDRLDEALRYAERLEAGTDTSSALSDLAKRLADGERLNEAQMLLPRIEGRDQRSHALSGIGRAKARAGDVAGAMQATLELANAQDVGRVLSAVVRVHSLAGDFPQATSVAGRIEEPEFQIEAWSEIARQAGRKQNKSVSERALSEAVRVADRQEPLSRDKALLSIVKSLAEAGNKAQVGEIKQRIGDEKMRARAEELAVRAEAKDALEQNRRGELPDALLPRSFSKLVNDEDKADLAIDLAGLPAGIAPAASLVRSIADDRFRGAAFRRLAEARSRHLLTPSKDEASDAPAEAEALAQNVSETDGSGQEVQTRRGLTLIKVDTAPNAGDRTRAPRTFMRADDVRAMAPWPSGVVVGTTFASHNPYISKFLDDGEDGASRLEQAIRYQGLPSPRIIVVQSGVATLGMVARQLQGSDARDLIAYDIGFVTVRAPILVAPGAKLILSRLDSPVYRLSTDAGAFIANAGELHIVDAEIVGYNEKAAQLSWSDKDKVDQFRPFLLTWGDGRTNVASSTLSALGYDNVKSYGLTYSSGPDQVAELRDQAQPTGAVVDNVFRNFYFGFHTYEAQGIHVVGNEYRDSIVYAIDSHDRSKGLTIAYNTAYGTQLRHGITVSREVDDHWIAGNLSFDNAGSGIVLDRNSTNNVLHVNSSFGNAQDGITVFESSCNILSDNHLAENKRDGLKVRNSLDIGAYGNRIEANANSGVSAYIANLLDTKSGEQRSPDVGAYAPVTSLSLRHNRFSGNGVGINTQGVSGLAMYSNQFVKQSRRLLGGDVRGLEGQVLRHTSQSDVLIASTCRPAKPVVACRLRDQGFFREGADLHVFNPQGSSDCTGTDGSVQQRAFTSTSQGT